MNLELTPEQNAAYIAAVLSAATREEFYEAHTQYGQLDTARLQSFDCCIETLRQKAQNEDLLGIDSSSTKNVLQQLIDDHAQFTAKLSPTK